MKRSGLARSNAKATMVDQVAASTRTSSIRRFGGGSRFSEVMNSNRAPTDHGLSATPNGMAAANQMGE